MMELNWIEYFCSCKSLEANQWKGFVLWRSFLFLLPCCKWNPPHCFKTPPVYRNEALRWKNHASGTCEQALDPRSVSWRVYRLLVEQLNGLFEQQWFLWCLFCSYCLCILFFFCFLRGFSYFASCGGPMLVSQCGFLQCEFSFGERSLWLDVCNPPKRNETYISLRFFVVDVKFYEAIWIIMAMSQRVKFPRSTVLVSFLLKSLFCGYLFLEPTATSRSFWPTLHSTWSLWGSRTCRASSERVKAKAEWARWFTINATRRS